MRPLAAYFQQILILVAAHTEVTVSAGESIYAVSDLDIAQLPAMSMCMLKFDDVIQATTQFQDIP